MRPIIIDMKDMSESREVYEERPNPLLIYFIYILAVMSVIIILWMFFSKIDIVVKGNGSFRYSDAVSVADEKESECHIQIYIEDDDIARLRKGQTVKYEIAAYPSSEYGYFSGEIIDIPRDITVFQGAAYYVVEATCDVDGKEDRDGEEVSLINGMSCQAKILVDEENVLRYLLKKIDLLD